MPKESSPAVAFSRSSSSPPAPRSSHRRGALAAAEEPQCAVGAGLARWVTSSGPAPGGARVRAEHALPEDPVGEPLRHEVGLVPRQRRREPALGAFGGFVSVSDCCGLDRPVARALHVGLLAARDERVVERRGQRVVERERPQPDDHLRACAGTSSGRSGCSPPRRRASPTARSRTPGSGARPRESMPSCESSSTTRIALSSQIGDCDTSSTSWPKRQVVVGHVRLRRVDARAWCRRCGR